MTDNPLQSAHADTAKAEVALHRVNNRMLLRRELDKFIEHAAMLCELSNKLPDEDQLALLKTYPFHKPIEEILKDLMDWRRDMCTREYFEKVRFVD